VNIIPTASHVIGLPLSDYSPPGPEYWQAGRRAEYRAADWPFLAGAVVRVDVDSSPAGNYDKKFRLRPAGGQAARDVAILGALISPIGERGELA
jgi:hypothetical protein